MRPQALSTLVLLGWRLAARWKSVRARCGSPMRASATAQDWNRGQTQRGKGWEVSIPLGTDENMARFGLVLICGADQAAVPAWRRWHEAHLQRLDVVGVDVQQVGKDGPHRADVARMHLQLGPLLQAAPRQAPGRLSAHGWATTCHTPLSIRVGNHRHKG